VPLVASAASCGLAIKTDWPELLGAPGEAVAARTVDIHELLLQLHAAGELDLDLPPLGLRVAYHEPCHLKAQPGATGTPAKLLSLLPGVTLTPLADSCCGIAGTFGMKEQNYELSMTMGRPLFDELRQAAPDLVATGCGTCQMQVKQGTGLPVAHPVKLLWDAYQRRAAPSGRRLAGT
jgi:glycerol-3-phosphate dehydrogenase subunit C